MVEYLESIVHIIVVGDIIFGGTDEVFEHMDCSFVVLRMMCHIVGCK